MSDGGPPVFSRPGKGRRLQTNQGRMSRSMAKVGGLEQENVPWCVERGEGTTVDIPGASKLWWDSIIRLFRIPRGTEWLSEVLFEEKFQSSGRGTDKAAFPFQTSDAVKCTASLRCVVQGLRWHPSRWISSSSESDEREISVTTTR